MQNRVMYLGLQETQLSNSEDIDVDGCWDSSEYGYATVHATGRSGGLMSIWDSNMFTVEEIIKTRYFLITVGRWSGVNGTIAFVNIYGPHNPAEKKKLWADLKEIKSNKGGTWIIFGDFNTVRKPEERYNSQFCPSSAFYFKQFINECGLRDISMGGHRYTYFCQSDLKLSKLDRFLVCPNFVSQFPNSSVTALPRELSDHCPILLTTSYADFGKTPFRFFNSWMLREGFDDIVLNS